MSDEPTMDMSTTLRWYFTFGMGQPNRDCYHVIVGTRDEARQKMKERFGRAWEYEYSEAEWVDGNGVSMAERFNLKELR